MDDYERLFADAVKLIRNDAAAHCVALVRKGEKPDGVWFNLYNALMDAYPEICADPNVTPG
jgi:hypothetical protein